MENTFPIEKLNSLAFGSVDGFRDNELENTFIKTRFVNRFLQDKHSIIIGPMGSGKSALFQLLKNKSEKMGIFQNKTIVSIDEIIPFSNIKKFATSLSSIDEKQIYQFIWKFHITQKISEKISNEKNFPKSTVEHEINNFLQLIKSKEYNESIIGKLSGLLHHSSFRLKTKIANTPIDIEASINKNIKTKETIHLDKILELCLKSTKERKMDNILVIIDKIDAFVAGEEYHTQRKYIEALLEVDDDMIISYPNIGHKIFLRRDLYARLNFERLGLDKVQDNTLHIKWTQTELIYFLGSRIKNALGKENILNDKDIRKGTLFEKIKEEGRLHKFIKYHPYIPLYIKKLFFNINSSNKERKDVSLKEKYMKLVITKVFPNSLIHKNDKCKEERIDIFSFFATHFFNAQNEVSPRNLLIFLKKVNDYAITYYDENRDKQANLVYINNKPEWNLYKYDFIYKAYTQSIKEFTRTIATTEHKWSKYFSIFLKKRGRRKVFTFSWIKEQTDLNDKDAAIFCVYLEYIGFLYVSEEHDDIKKRKYQLPIMYMPQCK
ncbi:MAG TPA: hypothetical protein EYG80_04245 [Flavobacteriaceae bacterium]|nr:hypothetical protein [Flavobacteriaceae bacterium]